jgi:hypothetical protein
MMKIADEEEACEWPYIACGNEGAYFFYIMCNMLVHSNFVTIRTKLE